MKETLNYIQENKQRYVDELFELLKIASISADPAYKDEVLKCADEVAKFLRDAGADDVEDCETKGYPIVFGQKFLDNTKDRLQELISFKKDNDFEIYVDGGINDETIKEVLNADGVISGSFICMNKDFENQIMKLKNSITQ